MVIMLSLCEDMIVMCDKSVTKHVTCTTDVILTLYIHTTVIAYSSLLSNYHLSYISIFTPYIDANAA